VSPLTRQDPANRRKGQELNGETNETGELDTDLRFFRRNPGRAYRLRRACPGELSSLAGLDARLPREAGSIVLVLVRLCQAPQQRVRLFKKMARHATVDRSEIDLKQIYGAWVREGAPYASDTLNVIVSDQMDIVRAARRDQARLARYVNEQRRIWRSVFAQLGAPDYVNPRPRLRWETLASKNNGTPAQA
jgi:hypothetical protein